MKRFLPYVQESIAALGYIKPEFDTALAIMLEANEGQHPKAIALAYRKNGEQITREEKWALGVRANVFYSREAIESLTDKGLSRPLEAHSTTLLRAMLGFFRERMIADARSHNVHQFRISRSHADCTACDRLSGTIVSSNEAAFLPPSDCQREACTLLLEMEIDFLAGIK